MKPVRPTLPRDLWNRLEEAVRDGQFEEGYTSANEAARDAIRQLLREVEA